MPLSATRCVACLVARSRVQVTPPRETTRGSRLLPMPRVPFLRRSHINVDVSAQYARFSCFWPLVRGVGAVTCFMALGGMLGIPRRRQTSLFHKDPRELERHFLPGSTDIATSFEIRGSLRQPLYLVSGRFWCTCANIRSLCPDVVGSSYPALFPRQRRAYPLYRLHLHHYRQSYGHLSAHLGPRQIKDNHPPPTNNKKNQTRKCIRTPASPRPNQP